MASVCTGGLNCAAFAGGVVQAFLNATQFVSAPNISVHVSRLLTIASKGPDILAQATQDSHQDTI